MPSCRDCCGRGRVLRCTTTADAVPSTCWQKCGHCQGKGVVAGPTLLPWAPKPSHIGTPDRCDQCNTAAPLWSFELADDEPALCAACLAALHKAIGKTLKGQARPASA